MVYTGMGYELSQTFMNGVILHEVVPELPFEGWRGFRKRRRRRNTKGFGATHCGLQDLEITYGYLNDSENFCAT